jgi:hypothetical protein
MSFIIWNFSIIQQAQSKRPAVSKLMLMQPLMGIRRINFFLWSHQTTKTRVFSDQNFVNDAFDSSIFQSRNIAIDENVDHQLGRKSKRVC